MKFLIIFEGFNDITHPTANDLPEQTITTEQLIGGLKQLIARAHDHQIKVIGVTELPCEGTPFYSAEIEAKRQTLNQWIRTGKAYDAVIDFEAVVRDPNHPTRVRPDYDSGDHGHLNDAGYRAMAEAIDLKLFTGP